MSEYQLKVIDGMRNSSVTLTPRPVLVEMMVVKKASRYTAAFGFVSAVTNPIRNDAPPTQSPGDRLVNGGRYHAAGAGFEQAADSENDQIGSAHQSHCVVGGLRLGDKGGDPEKTGSEKDEYAGGDSECGEHARSPGVGE